MADTDRGDWIQTFTGRKFYPFDPRPEDISIVDIAHHLALENRYNGATLYPISVAQHSAHVRGILLDEGQDVEVQACGLMHDASEAYLKDILRPMKRHVSFAGYRLLEDQMMKAIFEKYGLPYHCWDLPRVRYADDKSLATEKRDMMMVNHVWDSLPDPCEARIPEWTWQKAEGVFLAAATTLGIFD